MNYLNLKMKFLNLFIYFFFSEIFPCACIKMSKTLSAKHYQKNKERLKKKAHKRYQSLSKEEKEKKRQYVCECYKNLLEDEKQMLVEYRKRYYRMRKK